MGTGRTAETEDLLRDAAQQVLAAVVRRFGDFGDSEDTDWREILGLYGLLERMTGNPMPGSQLSFRATGARPRTSRTWYRKNSSTVRRPSERMELAESPPMP